MSGRKVQSVCIIGGGASGLPCIKACVERGLKPTCFERDVDLGGIWHYTDKIDGNYPTVMSSTTANTSKEIVAYSDFPPPKEWPNYLHNRLLWKYMDDYAEKFALKKYIRYQTEVVNVAPEGKRWRVRWVAHPPPGGKAQTANKGESGEEVFDAVMVCCGAHTTPYIPKIPGADRFAGRLMHTQEYRERPNTSRFENSEVIVVGFGNSGLDLAVELSRVSKKVYLLARHTKWVTPRYADGGYPQDSDLTRMNVWFMKTFPLRFINWFGEQIMTKHFDHHLYGIDPEDRLLYSAPGIQDGLLSCLATGAIELVRDSIGELAGKDVKLSGGRVLKNIDYVFLATGYNCSFPYLDKSIFAQRSNRIQMHEYPFYKYMFEPQLAAKNPTLAFIGYLRTIGPHLPPVELQARYATLVFAGERSLPSEKDMWADIEARRQRAAARFQQNPDSHSGLVECDGVPFNDELAALIGCGPPLVRLFFTDNKLWRAIMFASASAYQFRLRGPDAWKGARAAILEQDERMRYPMRRPAIEVEERERASGKSNAKGKCLQKTRKRGVGGKGFLIMLMLFVALISVLVMQYRPELAQSALSWAKTTLCPAGAFAKALKWVGLR